MPFCNHWVISLWGVVCVFRSIRPPPKGVKNRDGERVQHLAENGQFLLCGYDIKAALKYRGWTVTS